MMPWDDQPQANLGFSKECNIRDFTQDIGSQQNFKPPLSSPGQSSGREQRCRHALSWCHDMPLGYDGTLQQWCVVSMQRCCCSMAEWHFGDGMKTKCHGSILLSFRVEESVAIWQSRQLFGLKIYVKEKKKRKIKPNNPINCVLDRTTLYFWCWNKRCLGPDTEWENHSVRKFLCPTFQMWNVHNTTNRAPSLCSVP